MIADIEALLATVCPDAPGVRIANVAPDADGSTVTLTAEALPYRDLLAQTLGARHGELYTLRVTKSMVRDARVKNLLGIRGTLTETVVIRRRGLERLPRSLWKTVLIYSGLLLSLYLVYAVLRHMGTAWGTRPGGGEDIMIVDQ